MESLMENIHATAGFEDAISGLDDETAGYEDELGAAKKNKKPTPPNAGHYQEMYGQGSKQYQLAYAKYKGKLLAYNAKKAAAAQLKKQKKMIASATSKAVSKGNKSMVKELTKQMDALTALTTKVGTDAGAAAQVATSSESQIADLAAAVKAGQQLPPPTQQQIQQIQSPAFMAQVPGAMQLIPPQVALPGYPTAVPPQFYPSPAAAYGQAPISYYGSPPPMMTREIVREIERERGGGGGGGFSPTFNMTSSSQATPAAINAANNAADDALILELLGQGQQGQGYEGPPQGYYGAGYGADNLDLLALASQLSGEDPSDSADGIDPWQLEQELGAGDMIQGDGSDCDDGTCGVDPWELEQDLAGGDDLSGDGDHNIDPYELEQDLAGDDGDPQNDLDGMDDMEGYDELLDVA